jgi:hypothetical protein
VRLWPLAPHDPLWFVVGPLSVLAVLVGGTAWWVWLWQQSGISFQPARRRIVRWLVTGFLGAVFALLFAVCGGILLAMGVFELANNLTDSLLGTSAQRIPGLDILPGLTFYCLPFVIIARLMTTGRRKLALYLLGGIELVNIFIVFYALSTFQLRLF